MFVLRRLVLGILLIAATSSALLISDWNRRVTVVSNMDLGSGGIVKKWNVRMIQYNNIVDVEETERGVLDGLEEAALVDGRDYTLKIQNAQGDMSTVNALVDAALSEGADLLITMSTPTLQSALRKAGSTPIVFTYLANAVAAGAGRSDHDHLPNVTGVYMMSAYEQMIELIRECMPSARNVGSLFVPAETNMVFHKEQLDKAGEAGSISVLTVAANTSAEVADAALALCSQEIDAVCQMPGNLTAAAFPSIASAAQKAKLPIFAFQTIQAYNGAMAVLARDYYQAGKDAGLLAARVIRGEDPASIPFQSVEKTMTIVNLKAAAAVGLRLPQSLLDRADKIIDEDGTIRERTGKVDDAETSQGFSSGASTTPEDLRLFASPESPSAERTQGSVGGGVRDLLEKRWDYPLLSRAAEGGVAIPNGVTNGFSEFLD